MKIDGIHVAHSTATRTTDNVFYSSDGDTVYKNTAAGMRESLGLNNVNNTGATVAATADKIVLRDSGGDIFAAGVGIGTTSPRGMLDIYTGATSTAGLIIDRYASGTYRSELYQESNGLAIKVGDGSNAPAENMRITRSDVMIPGRLALGTSTASSSQFYISAPGNGTSTSTGDLHVNNSAGMTLYGTRPWITTTNGQGHTGKLCSINLHASDHQPAIEWTRDTGQGTNQRNWLLRQETDDALYTWHYNGSAWSIPMYVKSDAVISQVNVGIGVTDPDQKLEVRGNIKASYSDTNHGMFLDAGGTLRRDYGGAGAGFHFTNTAIWPTDYLGDYSAGGINFGDSSYRWNNVYTEELNASGEVITGTVNATSYKLTGDTTPHKQSIKNGTNLAVGWYRIAENGNAVDTASNGSRCSARFTIIDYDSGLHSTRTLYAGGTYGNKPFIHLLTNTSYGADGNISKVRVVEGSTYEGLAVEIYVDTACSTNEIRIVMDDNYQGSGFTMVDFESVVADHSNMNEYELDLNTTFWGMFLDNTTTNICMLESGNVGIGTASPSSRLHVNLGNASGEQHIRATQTSLASSTAGIRFGDSTWDAFIDHSHGSKDLMNFGFYRNPTRQVNMVLSHEGNVGIGTTNPGSLLTFYKDYTVPANGSEPADDTTQGITFRSDLNSFGASPSPGWSNSADAVDTAKIWFQPKSYQGISGSAGVHGYLAFGTGYFGSQSNTPDMVINTGGNVGIGTTTPYAKLHVHGASGVISNSTRMYFKYNGNNTNYYGFELNTGGWNGMGIYANGSIATYDFFVSHGGTVGASDSRIKKNIVDADDSECLETLRLLKPKKYQYKDEIERVQEPVWGFIAQEVRETLPYATQLRQDVIPNIYELANVSSSNVITFTDFNTSNLESNATTLIRTKGIDGEDHDIHLAQVIDEHTIRVEEDLSLWTGSVDAEGNVITQIETTTLTPEEYEALEDKTGCVANISGYQNANVVISVEEYNGLEDTAGYEEIIDNYTETVTTHPGTQLFVYGQEVDDFVFLKKDAIWTVATSALQEVDRQQQADKVRIAELESRVEELEAMVSIIKLNMTWPDA